MSPAAKREQISRIKIAALPEPKALGCEADTFVIRIQVVARGPPSVVHLLRDKGAQMRIRQTTHTHIEIADYAIVVIAANKTPSS